MRETWKDIKGYEGIYQINNIGVLRRIYKKKKGFGILKPTVMKIGYHIYSLSKNGVVEKAYGHRLVAEYFIDNPLNHKYVNHINGVKTDNRIENLEWCTQSHNIQQSFDTGLQNRGEDHHACTRLTEKDVLAIRNDYKELGDRSVAKIYDIHHGHVYRIRKKLTWKHI